MYLLDLKTEHDLIFNHGINYSNNPQSPGPCSIKSTETNTTTATAGGGGGGDKSSVVGTEFSFPPDPAALQQLQVQHAARLREFSESTVCRLIKPHTEYPNLVLGEMNVKQTS